MARIKLIVDNAAPRPPALLAPRNVAASPTPRPRMQHSEIAVTFEGLVIVMLAIRMAAHFALPQPLVGDARACFDMAQALAAGGWPTETSGQHAVGYPLLLAPFFALFGASTSVAFAVNLGLAMAAAMLVAALARALGYARMGEQLAVLGFAVWLPGIWASTTLARENLSTPLVLGLVLLAVKLGREGARTRPALAAGLIWAAAVLAGTSALPLIGAPLLGLALGARWRPARMLRPLLAMAGGAALLLGPCTAATQAMVGRPVIANAVGLDLGNAPATTGASNADMPAGTQATLAFAAHKLVLFWHPDVPQDHTFATGDTAITFMRLGDVAEYLAIVLLGVAGLLGGPVDPRWRGIVALAISGYWALHGLADTLPRYRDPIMPLLIVMAAGGMASFVQRRRDRAAALDVEV